MDKKRPVMIPRRDFIYLCIIVAIILIAVISYFLADSSRAGEALNFGATAVSIVLAVIAIVMTITESSAQKQNVLQLKEVVEDFKEQIHELNIVSSETKSHVTAVIEFKDQLVSELASSKKSMGEIMAILDNLSNKSDTDSVSVAEIREIKEKIEATNFSPVIGIGNSFRFMVGHSVLHLNFGVGVVEEIVSSSSNHQLLIVKFDGDLLSREVSNRELKYILKKPKYKSVKVGEFNDHRNVINEVNVGK